MAVKILYNLFVYNFFLGLSPLTPTRVIYGPHQGPMQPPGPPALTSVKTVFPTHMPDCYIVLSLRLVYSW